MQKDGEHLCLVYFFITHNNFKLAFLRFHLKTFMQILLCLGATTMLNYKKQVCILPPFPATFTVKKKNELQNNEPFFLTRKRYYCISSIRFFQYLMEFFPMGYMLKNFHGRGCYRNFVAQMQGVRGIFLQKVPLKSFWFNRYLCQGGGQNY